MSRNTKQKNLAIKKRIAVIGSELQISAKGVVSVSPRAVASSDEAKEQVEALREFTRAGGLHAYRLAR